MSNPSAGYLHTLVHYAPAAQDDLVHYRKDIGFRLPTGRIPGRYETDGAAKPLYRGRERQMVPILDLPLPNPPPFGEQTMTISRLR